MSTASTFASASASQSVCQTTAFIGSGAARDKCCGSDAVAGFSDDLYSLMQAPTFSSSTQLTTIVTVAGATYSAPVAQPASADSMMQLLQGLEQEMAKLSNELSGTASSISPATGNGVACAAATAQLGGTGLQGDYQTLYGEAVASLQNGSTFDVSLPSGETLSGNFSWGELEPAGDNSLFTPGAPSAPDAGRQAFDNAIAQFLTLAQNDSGSATASGQIASYSTATSFTGSNAAASWSGTFSLAPASSAVHKN